MQSTIKFNEEARKKILEGAEMVFNAVRVTQGAKGRNVVIGRKDGSIHTTKDGFTVASFINLEDAEHDAGASIIKQAAAKTVEVVGDGTTTAVVLAYHMMEQGMKLLAEGHSPVDLKKGMEMAMNDVIAMLKKMAEPIEGNMERIIQVATVSANNDIETGKLVADAISRITKDGIISVEKSNSTETTIKVTTGMDYDRGFLSPYFVNKQDRGEVVLENPYILIYSKKLTSQKQLINILTAVSNTDRSILVIADKFEQEVVQLLNLNAFRNDSKLKGRLAAIESPGFGDRQKEYLEDLAIVTKAKIIGDEMEGITIENCQIAHLGSCEKVLITKNKTNIIGGAGSQEAINSRAEIIKRQLKDVGENSLDKDRLERRLAKLIAGVAVVYVGAATEMESKEKKDRIDDAIAATRSGIEEGIVAGGGAALLHCANAWVNVRDDKRTEGVKAGGDLVFNMIVNPFIQIMLNAGLIDGSHEKQIIKSGYPTGYNLITDEVTDMLTAGIVDPVKVVRVALENAVSVAGVFITTECVIAEKRPIQK